MTGKELFDNYRKLCDERDILAIQIKNFIGVTDADIITSMCLSHPDDSMERVQTSGTSEKTAIVALNYRERLIHENDDWYQWLIKRYIDIDEEITFFENCIENLGKKLTPVVWDLLDEDVKWDDVCYNHCISNTTLARYRKEAIARIDKALHLREQQQLQYMLS